MNDLRTPLAKVRGLGSAKDGTHHFWVQRVSALALTPLVIWFGLSVASLPNASYASVVQWLDSPFNVVMLVSTLIAGFYHGALGLQVIIEDYVSEEWVRIAAIIAVQLVSFFLAALGIVAALKISLGA
ncbi:MAG: succinate dehydrogenase, hydrophobic membrane anchor protein [Gammaproteobacteria bacterium]|nr:succinate dehydrogenase, hydrophobic membrane anchor protein [Gammaproteobacteria bacterium]